MKLLRVFNIVVKIPLGTPAHVHIFYMCVCVYVCVYRIYMYMSWYVGLSPGCTSNFSFLPTYTLQVMAKSRDPCSSHERPIEFPASSLPVLLTLGSEEQMGVFFVPLPFKTKYIFIQIILT